MNTPTLRPISRRRAIQAQPLRIRAELPAAVPATRGLANLSAAHDFLVPNPRPDLTFDRQTLAMLEPV